jgi:hypothetical protein
MGLIDDVKMVMKWIEFLSPSHSRKDIHIILPKRMSQEAFILIHGVNPVNNSN